MHDLIELMLEIDGGETAEHLWSTLSADLLSRGVISIFYRHSPLLAGEGFEPKYLYTKNLPKSFSDSYISERLYESDILQMMTFTRGQNYHWLTDDSLKTTTEFETIFASFLMKYMRGKVLVLPVYGSSNRSGFFCLNFQSSSTEISNQTFRLCQMACNYAHIKYSQYLNSHNIQAISLSSRELEILRWVSRGNSNPMIADIMGISRHTVDSYLRRIFIKIDATDRTTAALKALNMGLLIR